MGEYINVVETFGCDVFNDSVMQARLPKKIYKELKKTIEEGKELSMEIADVVAHEMKEWAIEKGATHYSHWFQPLTGVTAEDNTDLIHSFKSARVTITTEEPVPWTLDGEYGGSHTQVEIENCHEALNLYLKSTKNEETKTIGISPLINKKEK